MKIDELLVKQPTSAECNDAWQHGYVDGWRKYNSTRPPIPTRPAYPAGVIDPLKYYYEAGLERGRAAGASAAGIKQP